MPPKLQPRPAVCAIIRFHDGRYLLQHRDDIPAIFYPGYWGLFGGAIEADETLEQGLARELEEELNLTAFEAKPFFRYDFSFQFAAAPGAGASPLARAVYEITLPDAVFDSLVLAEGQGMARVAPEALGGLKIIPYDAFALDMHMNRDRYILDA